MQEHHPPQWGSNSLVLFKKQRPAEPCHLISLSSAGKHPHAGTHTSVRTLFYTYKPMYINIYRLHTYVYGIHMYILYIHTHTFTKLPNLIFMVPWVSAYIFSYKADCQVKPQLQRIRSKAVENVSDLQ